MAIFNLDLSKTLEFLFNQYPYARIICAIVIIVLIAAVVAFVIIAIMRYSKGDKVSIFGIIKISKNEKLAEAAQIHKQLQDEFNIINAISKQRSILLDLFNDIHKEIGNLLAEQDRNQFYHRKNKLIDLILTSIVSHLTKHRDNYHRVALFRPSGDGTGLISSHHCGFFPGEYPNDISLPIGSAAGQVYLQKNIYLSHNVHNEPLFYKDPNHKIDYCSLLCVPIIIRDRCLGVLSLDGRKKNSFDEKDAEYLGYFATIIGVIIEMETFNEDVKIYNIERRYSNAGGG